MAKLENKNSVKEYKYYYSDGTTSAKLNDNKILHRDGDLPATECTDGTKTWHKEGKLHRDNDLPAVERVDGYKVWFKEGKYHRLTGPAVVFSNDNLNKYYIEDKGYSKEQFDIAVKALQNKNTITSDRFKEGYDLGFRHGLEFAKNNKEQTS